MTIGQWLVRTTGLFSAACLSACAGGPMLAGGEGDGGIGYGAETYRGNMQEPTVRYIVRLPAPQTQTAEVEMEITNVSGGTIDVALPVWRPGRYALVDPSTTISHVRAAGSDGRALAIEKIDKATWRVASGSSRSVRVTYRVYANSLNDRTRHIDDTHAFLSPATVFMYVPERRAEPVRVKVEAPSGWRTATGLPEISPGEFAASDYDVFVDSPLEIGLHDRHTFDVGGVSHEIIIWHAGAAAENIPKYDAEKMKADFAGIVESQVEIFGDMPYDRYVFMVHSGPDLRGGTEHLNSTIMQTTRAALDEPGAYKRFLGLVSHEMFHTWNVKQARPADLKPYDYAHENYTKLLWVVEGTTSYYDDLCLVRAGLMSPEDYLKMVKDMIEGELNKVGWDVQSLEESSLDAWVKFNKTWPDSVNTTMSFYSKGALVSLLLDLELRARTQGAVTLDVVMRRLYERFPFHGPGYTAADFLSLLNELSGSDFTTFLADYVAGTTRPNAEGLLNVVGLECRTTTKPEEPYLGLTLVEKEGRTLVTAALADGPAYAAGLNADDEIVALNGRRLRAADLDARIKAMKPGDEVTFNVLRRDELRTFRMTLAENRRTRWTVERVKEPTEAQRSAYKSWLGVDWEK